MRTKLIWLLMVLIIVLAVVFYYINQLEVNPDQQTNTPTNDDQPPVVLPPAEASPIDASYIINGQTITLVDGQATTTLPNTDQVSQVRVFGQPIEANLNNDAGQDAILLLVQSTGGSGTFYWVAAALKINDQFQGTEAVFLGDRIAPQTINFQNNLIMVSYAIRAAGEPFTVQPSIGVTKYLQVQSGQLVDLTAKDDLIEVNLPTFNAAVTSPLTVSGRARGNWYFEASFPLEVTDQDGNVLGQKYAEAQSDWMTTDYVAFSGTIAFTVPEGITTGYVVFKKDNPSGLPENDNSLSIPVTFQ